MQSLGLSHQPVAGKILDYYLNHSVPPLLILTGPQGVGKLDAALKFVKIQLCQAGTGCGSCSDCRLLQQTGDQAHPDFIVFPSSKVVIGDSKNPDDFTIRWLLQSRLPFKPYHSNQRFVLFPSAELVLHEAVTALLKTLEEPPDHTRFIFIAPSLESLKETIVSRGVHVPFYHIPLSTLKDQTKLNDISDLELLGGSYQLLDMISSELFRNLKQRVNDALSHQLGLLDLESYIREEAKRKPELEELDYSYEDLLQMMALLLLQITRRLAATELITESVVTFLSGVRMGQGGMIPFHLSRLFFQLNKILFEND
ncbi:MAG: hypothetical protein H3C43_01530 [Leptonema sp. (in: Bacteria)]|nr:hypothetical protein [Leptonema sp. (in: bacteria)]